MPRRTIWVDKLLNVTNISGGGGENEDLLSNIPQADRDGMTLLRTIVRLQFTPAVVSAVSGLQTCDYGIGLAREEAFSAGALPDIETQEDHPTRGWLVRSRTLVQDETTISVRDFGENKHDIRAMRKIEADTTLFLQFNNNNVEGTAFTTRMTGLIRLLLAHP